MSVFAAFFSKEVGELESYPISITLTLSVDVLGRLIDNLRVILGQVDWVVLCFTSCDDGVISNLIGC